MKVGGKDRAEYTIGQVDENGVEQTTEYLPKCAL